ncbi:pyridoxamine 5'-phosphate oxidase family protein [Nocardioides sp. W3-2-3]|uniref:pyridoxamine 5'-phosphate oxidase family protein n=1 Tax=Nocardioides convexus TaxID=2712224 RepID=UPI0024181502|nr:pyridoxamine 5'-phosphate oxidase family protein [Nocardioides convexus]NHA01653.1 pyridoxamine 5'-phosphate oxidase family protein [Nocardioides convexus]
MGGAARTGVRGGGPGEGWRSLWTTFAEAWMPEGPEDPNAVLLRVDVEAGEYWDTPGGKVASLISLAKTKAHRRDLRRRPRHRDALTRHPRVSDPRTRPSPAVRRGPGRSRPCHFTLGRASRR